MFTVSLSNGETYENVIRISFMEPTASDWDGTRLNYDVKKYTVKTVYFPKGSSVTVQPNVHIDLISEQD